MVLDVKKIGLWRAAYLVLLLFAAFSLAFGISPSFVTLVVVWSAALFYSLADLKNRGLLAAFLVSFFVFLIGGHFIYEYFGLRLSHFLGEEYYEHSNQLMIISLFVLLISYITFSAIIHFMKNQNGSRESWTAFVLAKKTIQIRTISRNLYLATYPFWFYLILEKAIFVADKGYLSYYTDYLSALPYYIRAIGAISPYAFFIYLASMPSKREIRFPLALYMIYTVVSLLTGRRAEFAISVLFLIVYIVIRHSLAIAGERWWSKKMWILLLALIPLLLVFLFSYNYFRLGNKTQTDSIWAGMLGFFQQQGISSSLMRLERLHAETLGDHRYFSFFGLLKWIRTNAFVGLFARFDYGFSYVHNNISFATLGNSLANSLSLIVLGEKRYLQGIGLGSCYIAELFHDFSYWGVVAGNMVYGVLMSGLSHSLRSSKHGVFRIALLFILFESFVRAPRWNFDIVFTQLLNLAMLATFGIVILLTYLCGDFTFNSGYPMKEQLVYAENN